MTSPARRAAVSSSVTRSSGDPLNGWEDERMADITTIFVAGIGAVTTLLNGVGGYWLSGRNDEARDNRTLVREEKARKADRADRLQEQRHAHRRADPCWLLDES
jgi:hypothetical protein